MIASMLDRLRRLNVDWRRLPVQFGVLVTLLLVPLWKRMPYAPTTYHPLYATGFLISIPIGLTIVAWLLAGTPGLRTFSQNRLRAAWAIALLLLALWMHLSVSWSFMAGHGQPNVAESVALQFSLVVLWALAAACAGPPARWMLAVLIFSGVWCAVLAIAQVANQGAVGLSWLGEFNISVDGRGGSVLQSGGRRWLRPYGLLSHPNVLAGVLLLAVLAAAAWVLGEKRRGRLVIMAAGGLILWGLLLTFSRSAWLGLAAGMMALFFLLLRDVLARRDLRRWVMGVVAVAVLVGGVFGCTYRDLLVSRTGVTGEGVEMRSVADRLVFTLFAYRATKESSRNALYGIGAGNFPWRSSYYLVETDYDLRGNNVHHVFLSALVEVGLVGYAMLVVALVCGVEAALRQLYRLRRSEAGPLRNEAPRRAALLAGFVALGVVGLFDHYPWTLIQFQVMWWGLLAACIRPAVPQYEAEAAIVRR